MDKTYKAKVTREVFISFDAEYLTPAECLQLAVDILENGDGAEGDDCVYHDLKEV